MLVCLFETWKLLRLRNYLWSGWPLFWSHDMCLILSDPHVLVWLWHWGKNICHHRHHVPIVLLNSHWSCSEPLMDFAPGDFELGLTNTLSVLKNSLFKNRNIKMGQICQIILVQNNVTHYSLTEKSYDHLHTCSLFTLLLWSRAASMEA